MVGTRSPPPAAKRSAGFTTLPAWFFAAFCRALVPPTTKRVGGLRVGARAEMRYAAEPPRAQPRLRSALGLRPRLRASFKSAETADFQRRLSVRAFQGHFLGKIGRFWAYGGPRDPILPKKRPPKALQGRLQLVRQPPDHLLNGGLPARRGLWTAPGTVPTARGAFGTGVAPVGAPRHDLSIL